MFKILEIIWLALGVIGVLMTGYTIITKDNGRVGYFIIFTLLAGIMYSVRRRQRLRYESNQKTNQ